MAVVPNINDVVKEISDDIKTMVQGHIELAKAEIVPQAKKVGIGAGLLGGAGYFGLNAATLLYVAASLGIGVLFGGTAGGVALGFLIVAVALLLLAGLLALIGKGNVEAAKNLKPERTIAEAEFTVAEVKGAIERGKASVPATVMDPPREWPKLTA